LTRTFQAFTANMDVAHAPEDYFKIVDTPLNIMKTATYCSVTIVADALIVYRTFVIWDCNWWIIILPTLALMADFALSVWFTWSTNVAQPGESVIGSAVFLRSKYFMAVTLVLNIMCTFLISFRIWRIQSQVGCVNSTGRGANVITIVLESAAIYSAVLVVLIVLTVAESSPYFFFLNSMCPFIGIVFSYIMLRSSTNDYQNPDSALTGTGARTSLHESKHRSLSTRVPNGVHIHLQQIVHDDGLERPRRILPT